jgi:bis(5'-nucleosyl)-tetraphosphatase (symmetrical)
MKEVLDTKIFEGICMSTYVFGDIHGCFDTFQALLKKIQWNPKYDTLWCVGDLINRGPKSLAMMEWILDHQDHVQCILGNHEIHLLACYAGASFGFGDTIDECLTSPKADEIISWMQKQPLIYQDGSHAMVHAGISPLWSWQEACDKAKLVESVLQSDDGLSLLAHFHPSRKKAKLTKTIEDYEHIPEWVKDLGWFTRVRTLNPHDQMNEKFKGSLDHIDQDSQPWFNEYQHQVKNSKTCPSMLYFGHWAALGIYVGEHVYSLDSGCIWGRKLSALRLEDHQLFQQKTVDRSLVPKNKRKHTS